MSELESPDGSTRLADVLDEYFRALAAGKPPSREELFAAHPDVAEDLAAALFGLDFVRGAAPSLSEDAEAAAAEPGRSLGDYRLLREVGRGGMAVVYEAEQVSLGRRVALKVLPFAAVLDPKQLQRFKNEAMAAANLRHPNIVPVHAVGCERGVHYYAMQFVEGQSLAAAIREMRGEGGGDEPRTPISSHGSNRDTGYVRMAARLGVQAAHALDHAHQVGIVHRDVKPANLLVDLAGVLWVTDFGLACSLRDARLTTTGEIVGTVRYMSPEQALGKRVPVDHRTDVYSLGATLYELFTLEAAFPGQDPHVVIQDIAMREAVPPRRLNPSLPVDLETVLMKAMAKDPSARYATAQEMADDLGRFLEDRPVLARRPSLLERAARWSRRHRAGVAAALLVLLVGAAALVIGAKREEKNTREALAKSEANLDLAFYAVQRFLTQFSGWTLDNEPTVTPQLRFQLEAALEFYDRYLSERKDANGHTDRGNALALLGRFDEALAAADRAIAIDPSLSRAHFARGAALRRLGRPEEALRAFDRVLELDPNRYEAFLERGVALKELGRPEESLAAIDRAIAIAPSQPTGHNNRGQYFDALGRHAEALANYDRAVQVEPRFFIGHVNRSISLLHLGRLPEALEAVDRAIALGPDEAAARLHKSTVLDQLGRLDQALAETERAIALDPKLGRAHYNRAVILNQLGRREEVLAALDRSIELEPTYANAHVNRGQWLQQAGRYAESLEVFGRAVALDPRNALARFNWALLLSGFGSVKESAKQFEAALALEPEDPHALCHYGVLLARRGQPRKGLLYLRKGHEIGSKRSDWTYPSASWIKMAQELESFEDRLDRAPGGDPPPRDHQERVGFAMVLAGQRRFADAARLYGEAFKEFPPAADDLVHGYRYDAALSAVLAAGEDGAKAPMWRRRALKWLRADLDARVGPPGPPYPAFALESWRLDPDLATVRDRIDALPLDEREGWTTLWADVAARLAAPEK